jgi:hypothetical protein
MHYCCTVQLTLLVLPTNPKQVGAQFDFHEEQHTWGQTLQKYPPLYGILKLSSKISRIRRFSEFKYARTRLTENMSNIR